MNTDPNLAVHDPEEFMPVLVEINDSSVRPRCPVCKSLLSPLSKKESNRVWVCHNYASDKSGYKCTFIEGKFSPKKRRLWDCRYEPSCDLEECDEVN